MGKVDLAVSSIDNYLGTLGSVSIIPNIGTEGNIAFGTIFTIHLNGAPIEIQSDDFDNDGSPDIVLKNGNSISILRNLSRPGNFSFDTPINFDVFNSSSYVYYCIGDFDGDGKPDMVTSGDSTVYVMHNTSSNNIISFDTKLNFAAMHQVIESVCTGQLDGDGKPDLVVVGEKKIYAFHNESSTGSISFATPVVYTPKLTYNWTDAAAIGDIDGDGKPDIVTANAADQKISIFKSGIWESVDSVCGNNNTSMASDISGSTYQWQVNTGAGFMNLSEDSIHEGVTMAALEIHHIPVQYNGYQFRCLVDGNSRNTTNLFVTPTILPLGSASSPDKICADSIFKIKFTAINDIPLNSAIEIWESINNSSFTKIASQPYNGVPIETPLSVTTASTRSCFFRIIPMSTTLCGLPNNSDTTSIVITQLSVPVIAAVGDTITISNSTAGVSYTWQIQDAVKKWNDIVPAANGNSYTAIVSGNYRVIAMQNGCIQYSNKQSITIDSVPNYSPEMKVYPNPASNQITVEHPASDAGANIRVYDMMGRIVKLVLVQENSTRTIIHVENLTPGIFKLILTDGKDLFTRTVLISR